MSKTFTLLFGAAALSAVFAWHSNASANCAMPVGYQIAVEDNSVTVCPENHANRACPDSSAMLRENPTTDEVVQLADFCGGTGYSGACYVDECVPPGTYRYGFATPYDCCPACCGTSYFTEVTIDTELPTDCARSEGNSAPAAFSGSIPWGDEQIICDYEGPSGFGGTGGTGGTAGSAGEAGSAGVAGSAGDAGSASQPADSDDDGGGCSLSARPQTTVFAVNVLALVFGLGVLARRRRRQR